MPRYFLAANAGSPVAGVWFDPIEVSGGTLFGVYATDNVEEATKLAETKGVEEITQAQYEANQKKKARTLTGHERSIASTAPEARASSLKEPVGHVVETGASSGQIGSGSDPQLKSAAEVIETDTVETAPEMREEPPPKRPPKPKQRP